MELNDLFNISDEQMATLEKNASDIPKTDNRNDDVESYSCICCSGGICTIGIAPG